MDGLSQGQLSRIESGGAPIRDLDRLIAWARALRMPSHLLWFEVPDQPEHPAREPRPLTPALVSARPDTLLADRVLATIREFAATDNLGGPRGLLQVAPAHLTYAESLIADARGKGRRCIVFAAARAAEFAGWVHQDAGDLATAARFTEKALRFGAELADRSLTSYVLMRLSNIRGDAGDAAGALTLAERAAQTAPADNPAVRAVALRQQAAALLLSGSTAAAGHVMDRALGDVSKSEDGRDDLTVYCTSAWFEMEAATCWVRLGHAEQAITAFERGLSGWQPQFRRDLGLCLARAASAYAAVGDTERASEAVSQATELARATGSARTAAEVARARTALVGR